MIVFFTTLRLLRIEIFFYFKTNLFNKNKWNSFSYTIAKWSQILIIVRTNSKKSFKKKAT